MRKQPSSDYNGIRAKVPVQLRARVVGLVAIHIGG